MTADQLVHIVRRGYHVVNTADTAILTKVFDANATWETPGRSPVAGLFTGRNKVFAHFGTYGGETVGTFRAELQFVAANARGTVY